MKVNIRDARFAQYAVPDETGELDWTNALLAALDAARTRFSFGSGMVTTPGTHALVEVPAELGPDGKLGPLRISQTIPLRSGDHYRGDSSEASAFLFTHGGDGFVLDAGYTQAAEDFGFEALGIHSLADADGTRGIWCKGGGHAALCRDVTIGGFDRAVVLTGSELIDVDRLKVASWVGRQLPTEGVVFDLAPQGGGVTNRNSVSRSQFNGPRYAIRTLDGAGNLVESCNFNACGAMLLAEGSQGLVIRGCLAEGAYDDALILCGRAGGYLARICWQSLSVEDCVLTIGAARRDGLGTSALIRTARGAQGQHTSLRGTRILGGRSDGHGGDLGACYGDASTGPFLTASWVSPQSYDGAPVDTWCDPTASGVRSFFRGAPWFNDAAGQRWATTSRKVS